MLGLKSFALKRSHFCHDLSSSDKGKKVVVMGWVESVRDHGDLVFVILRDRTGLLQVVCEPGGDVSDVSLKEVKSLKSESVVAFCGEVILRPLEKENHHLSTGKIELKAEFLHIFSQAKELPFQIPSSELALKIKKEQKNKVSESHPLEGKIASENLRLKYRYLDLRSPQLQNSLKVRHQTLQKVREFFSREEFWEIDTPLLYKSTPEGAQDYLVPSRVHPGKFYALPQSPQTLKQLLMVGGVERYFQVSKCFRDEDLRANRQPEFTQIDMEMSFVESEEEIMDVNERLLKFLWKSILDEDIQDPLIRLPYSEVMERFGTDRPDLRVSWELKDLSSIFKKVDSEIFKKVLAQKNGVVLSMKVPVLEALSQTRLKKWMEKAKEYGAKGLLWVQKKGEEFSSPLGKILSQEVLRDIFVQSGDLPSQSLVFLVADDQKKARTFLSALRSDWAQSLNLLSSSQKVFLWITDFPLFEWDEEEGRWTSCHHPFTSPKGKGEDFSILFEKRELEYNKLTSKSFDLVCNGEELGGGSVRIYDTRLQKALFSCLGLKESEIQSKFGFFIEALEYGAPPHGGMAWGFDRLMSILCGTSSIRDVIAFPKTRKASDLMSGAPDTVENHFLRDLGLSLIK